MSNICSYLFISMHIYSYLCISIHIYAYLFISIHIYSYLFISTIHIYIYNHDIYIYIYTYTNIYIYQYISIKYVQDSSCPWNPQSSRLEDYGKDLRSFLEILARHFTEVMMVMAAMVESHRKWWKMMGKTMENHGKDDGLRT